MIDVESIRFSDHREKTDIQLYQESFDYLHEALKRFHAMNHNVRSREMSLAITNLEQAIMWAVKDAKERNT